MSAKASDASKDKAYAEFRAKNRNRRVDVVELLRALAVLPSSDLGCDYSAEKARVADGIAALAEDVTELLEGVGHLLFSDHGFKEGCDACARALAASEKAKGDRAAVSNARGGLSAKKHTPGPWHRRIGRKGDGSAASQHEQFCNAKGRAVFMVEHDGSPEGNANVQVALAAPAMFAVLAVVAAGPAKQINESDADFMVRVRGLARAAIEKARAE